MTFQPPPDWHRSQSEPPDYVVPPTIQQSVCAQQEGTSAAFLWHRMFFLSSRPRHPLTPARPLTSAMEWWELRRKGAILQCDSVLLRAWRERKEIICAWSLAQAEAVSLRPHKHNSLTDQCGLYSGGGVDECIQCTSAFHWTSAT